MKSKARQQGFTIVQMVITIAIIAVLSTFGVLGIRTARAEFRLQSSARLFATYVEKARLDAIRRHAAPGQESSIETYGPGTTGYAVTMDWGSGVVERKDFVLDDGLSFSTAARTVSFDWRGRITQAWVFQIFSSYLGMSLPVDVSGSGDITVGEQHFPDQLIPEIEISQITGDVDIDPPPPAGGEEGVPADENDPDATPTPTPTPTATPTPTPNGNGNGGGGEGGTGNGNGNGGGQSSPTPTPTPNPSPTPVLPQCVATLTPSTLSLSQSDPTKQSGSVVFTMASATGTRIISAAQAGNGNSLVVDLSLVRIDGNGSSTVTITTKNGAGNRGVFLVQVTTDPACGTAPTLTVSVSN
jgi:type II secretory pathway pseudopilin PulG